MQTRVLTSVPIHPFSLILYEGLSISLVQDETTPFRMLPFRADQLRSGYMLVRNPYV